LFGREQAPNAVAQQLGKASQALNLRVDKTFCIRTQYFFSTSELMDSFVAGRAKSAADPPINQAQSHPPL
jgi:hypothetical protein